MLMVLSVGMEQSLFVINGFSAQGYCVAIITLCASDKKKRGHFSSAE